jgi:hypothetical protein
MSSLDKHNIPITRETAGECIEFLKKKLGITQQYIQDLTITFKSDELVAVSMVFFAQEPGPGPALDKRFSDIQETLFNSPLDVTARV